MRVKGLFVYLGLESSAPDSEKTWNRIGLTQGVQSRVFYISDDTVLAKIKKLNPAFGQKVEAEISISESNGRTYFSIVNLETV